MQTWYRRALSPTPKPLASCWSSSTYSEVLIPSYTCLKSCPLSGQLCGHVILHLSIFDYIAGNSISAVVSDRSLARHGVWMLC
jgi:hypothetical protein